jgi:MerR family transcriptional regulator, light-induced transcriptional regulator
MGSRPTAGYRIRTAARLAGLTPEVIRAWERRYGLTSPARSAGRFRLYTENDIQLLRGAKALVDAGQSIGEVARLPPRRLREAAGEVAIEQAIPRTAETPRLEQLRTEALAAARTLDRARLERALDSAAGALAPLDLVDRLLLPILRDLGEAWHRGDLSVAAEHFASSMVRSRLVGIVERMPRWPAMPRMVCACPAGELHEGALLAFAAHAAASGWEIVYLGADVPDGEIFQVAAETGARGVALSLTLETSDERLRRIVEVVKAQRARGFAPRVVLGGRGIDQHRALLDTEGLDLAEDVRPVPPP